MKIIRMLKTMAGPYGIYPAGQVRTVEDVTAAMLIGAEAAELVANIVQPVIMETAALEPAPETSVEPKVVAKKKRG